MKSLILAATLLSAAVGAQAQVGVSLNIGQPGFYGRLDIGDFPAPQLIYPQPIIVQRPAYYAGRPIYLRVPPTYARDWPRYCNRYNACNQEVYFVQDSWYTNQYVPRYRQMHPDRHDGRPGYRPPQQHGKPNRPNDNHGNRPGNGPGNGNGNGHGNRPGNDNGHRPGNGHDGGPGHGNRPGNGQGNGHGDDRGNGRR